MGDREARTRARPKGKIWILLCIRSLPPGSHSQVGWLPDNRSSRSVAESVVAMEGAEYSNGAKLMFQEDRGEKSTE